MYFGGCIFMVSWSNVPYSTKSGPLEFFGGVMGVNAFIKGANNILF